MILEEIMPLRKNKNTKKCGSRVASFGKASQIAWKANTILLEQNNIVAFPYWLLP